MDRDAQQITAMGLAAMMVLIGFAFFVKECQSGQAQIDRADYPNGVVSLMAPKPQQEEK